MNNAPLGKVTAVTVSDLSAASRFADCCYDDRLRMPSREAMERLVELGVVERLETGAYAETALLRRLGF
jgi:hypothetical protein